MFIDAEIEVRLSGNTLDGIEISWFFDPMFTAAVKSDFDTDRNGVFSQAETNAVYSGAFSNLENSDYFTFLEINGEIISPDRIEDFSVFMEEETLVYRFFCPFGLPVQGNSFKIAIYDSTFYCDILYREGSPVRITGREAATCEIVQSRDISISYGGSVSVSREGTSYSGTAYPQQLVVRLN